MAESRGPGWRLASLMSRTRTVVQRLGWSNALLSMCSTLGRRASIHIFVITTRSLDESANTIPAVDGQLETRFLSNEEVILNARDQGYWYNALFADDALSRGDRCFGVLDHGRLLSYCWYARGFAPVFDDVQLSVEFPHIYGYNAFTDPAHRGGGLHIYGVLAAVHELRREGMRGVTAYIEADNLAPLMSARKMGEQFVGYVLLFRAFGKFRWLATPGCLKGGLRMSRRTGRGSDPLRKIRGKTQTPA
jgi:hypothetical protein